MSERTVEINMNNGAVETFSDFKREPAFEIHTGTGESPDMLLILDGDVVEGGYLLVDVKSFWILNPSEFAEKL